MFFLPFQFVLVLNAKKAKLRELRNEIQHLKGETKHKEQPPLQGSDSENEGDNTNTDEE